MTVSATLHHLADAIQALESAYAATDDGFTSEHIRNAERECYKALDQLVKSQQNLD